MLDLQLPIVEINLGPRVWSGAKPQVSIHKHIGYVMYRDSDILKISPELTFTREGRHLRIGHEVEINLHDKPRPQVSFLRRVKRSTGITQIIYDDPFHRKGIQILDEVRALKTSILHLLGYIVQETDSYIWMAIAKFEYEDRSVDFETPHVIPKSSMLSRSFFSKK